MDAGGLDSDGRGFSSAKEMWREEIGIGEAKDGSKRHEWYRKGIAYWQVSNRLFSHPPPPGCLNSLLSHFYLKAVEASVDGVLGGYGHVNEADVKGSAAFLNTLLPNRFGTERRHLVALGSLSRSPCAFEFRDILIFEFLYAEMDSYLGTNIEEA